MLFYLKPIISQELLDIKFNHLTFGVENQDLKALRESSFIKDTLVVLETRNAKDYLYSQSNYLELYGNSSSAPNLGFLTVVFGVDKLNGLQELKLYLDKSYKTLIRSYDRNVDGDNIPWYDSLAVLDTTIIDSSFTNQAHFWFWIMGYKAEYFKHNGYTIENNELTCENYLEKYGEERKGKLIKRFTGIVIKLNSEEKKYLTKLFKVIEYEKLNENEYQSPDEFRFVITDRKPDDQNSLVLVEFEISRNFLNKKVVNISDKITVSIQGNKGQMLFK